MNVLMGVPTMYAKLVDHCQESFSSKERDSAKEHLQSRIRLAGCYYCVCVYVHLCLCVPLCVHTCVCGRGEGGDSVCVPLCFLLSVGDVYMLGIVSGCVCVAISS